MFIQWNYRFKLQICTPTLPFNRFSFNSSLKVVSYGNKKWKTHIEPRSHDDSLTFKVKRKRWERREFLMLILQLCKRFILCHDVIVTHYWKCWKLVSETPAMIQMMLSSSGSQTNTARCVHGSLRLSVFGGYRDPCDKHLNRVNI